MKKITAIMAAIVATGAIAQQGTITSNTPRGPLTMTTYDYTAGAFCSLVLRGVQFIDSKDHGRCLQSASSFDGLGEAFNPTEAGASMFTDVMRASTSSVPLNYVLDKATLASESRMAYWFPVGGRKTSEHIHRKYVQAGLPGLPQAIAYQVQFEIPKTETHSAGVLEVLTGYMPSSFSRFNTINIRTGGLGDVSDGPGEQALPLIFSAPGGEYAMGVWSPDNSIQYGRWRFGDCVKWNMVSRVSNPTGTYRFQTYIVVGTIPEVIDGLTTLYRRTQK